MPDRESRKKQITAKRCRQILDAALDVFAQKGYTAATIPEIAKLAGAGSRDHLYLLPLQTGAVCGCYRELDGCSPD